MQISSMAEHSTDGSANLNLMFFSKKYDFLKKWHRIEMLP